VRSRSQREPPPPRRPSSGRASGQYERVNSKGKIFQIHTLPGHVDEPHSVESSAGEREGMQNRADHGSMGRGLGGRFDWQGARHSSMVGSVGGFVVASRRVGCSLTGRPIFPVLAGSVLTCATARPLGARAFAGFLAVAQGLGKGGFPLGKETRSRHGLP
jgi:hypothetical protein